MKFFSRLTERHSNDPQEARAMAGLRIKSIEWLIKTIDRPEVEYAFRDEGNRSTIMFLDCSSHVSLHKLLDGDPLISYCELDLEPLLTTLEMVEALSEYLKLDQEYFSKQKLDELEFPRRPVNQDGTYYLARKVLNAFSPLLPIDVQDDIHRNTMMAQRAHFEPREICDYNPVAKPVGILLMEAASWDEVIAHVSNCEVYVDTKVFGGRLLTPKQAMEQAREEYERYNVGVFRGR